MIFCAPLIGLKILIILALETSQFRRALKKYYKKGCLIFFFEKKLVEIASEIDVKISDTDIEACHRFKYLRNNKEKRNNVRFVNRKVCDQLHPNKKNLC